MIEETIEKPGKMTAFYKAMREANDDNDDLDRKLLPSYLEKDAAIMRGGSTLSGLGMPPIEAMKFLDDPGRTFESALTPFLKIPMEVRTNFNTFKDKQITEDKSGEFARKMPDIIKEWLEWEESSYVNKKTGEEISYSKVNPMRKYWLYALPTGRIVSTLANTMDDRKESKVLKLMTNINNQRFELDALKARKEKEYEEKLLDLMLEAGVYSDYRRATPTKSSNSELQGL
jgi:hypothetical protein